MIGQTIRHYKILSRLGVGGMGEVFLADDTKLDRQVALKFLPVATWNDADAHQRLIREAKAASQLDHPNIVTIYGIEEYEERPFIIMAFVSGTTLDKYIASRTCTIDELVGLALQIVEGLEHAHDAGVIHRDLKPGNILVDDRGRIRILDFGLAWMRGATRLTHAGSFVGTLGYSPPELIRSSEPNPASDIYTVGVILYQMLTGHLPFQAQREEALLYSILQEDPQPLSAYNPSIPENLQAVIMRCLEKQPSRRFANCAELATNLRSCRSGELSGTKDELTPDRPSVAVLPFVNRSASSEDEYFSDGLADELRNMLAKIQGVRVAAGASSFQFKEKHEDLSVIGQKLNVATLLHGSVRKSGDRVRISVELVKASDGCQLWSETYDRALDDIFAVQDDIAHSVVNELRMALLGEEQDSNTSRVLKVEVLKAAMGRGRNAEAHRLYLQGRHLIERPNRANLDKGIGYLKQALDLAPDFALAWVELGTAYSRGADAGWIPFAEGYANCRKAVEHAMALEPNLAEAHVRMAWIQIAYDWDWRSATASCHRALELAPESPLALRGAASLAAAKGHLEEAISIYRRILELDPLNWLAYNNLGCTLYDAGRFAEAEETLRKLLELASEYDGAHGMIAVVLLAQDRNDEALAEASRETSGWSRSWAKAIVHHAMGHHRESDEAVEELIREYQTVAAYQIAEVFGVRGEVDAAFEWLERAYSLRDGGLANVQTCRHFRPLLQDPRWMVFLKKMGFEH